MMHFTIHKIDCMLLTLVKTEARFDDAVKTIIMDWTSSNKGFGCYTITNHDNQIMATALSVGHIIYITTILGKPQVEVFKAILYDEGIRIESRFTKIVIPKEPNENSSLLV